nr:immunoglobulin heavy chain junction region [Macaca mulatta]MOV54064.1 immunoglobulin heavy chain junction region [Macaca mulatta]MOV54598.1 immunoglobulin heavy chain junction region [Macaca mulatta]MOV55137.1 immunoglobulin heavy chain junction region [Macaca mulatta]MOV55687.1 immunoglobulin heavy chain junction region [Macaca mulatta]
CARDAFGGGFDYW